MRALDEAGIPVDAIGGTSIGAVMGSFRALDLDAATREAWALSGFVDSGNLFPPTLPVLSFSSARKVRDLLESPAYLGDRLIEETWIPFFCVSANLTKAETVVHDRGPLATAVRASLSLPGIFPPVRMGPDLLVDGGVLNNLPVDIMRERFRGGTRHCGRSGGRRRARRSRGYRETPSGWALLVNRLQGKGEADATPLSLNVLMRAKELAGIKAQRQIFAENPPDVLIRPDVSGRGDVRFQASLSPDRRRLPGHPQATGGERRSPRRPVRFRYPRLATRSVQAARPCPLRRRWSRSHRRPHAPLSCSRNAATAASPAWRPASRARSIWWNSSRPTPLVSGVTVTVADAPARHGKRHPPSA